jgi:hypothetical protein
VALPVLDTGAAPSVANILCNRWPDGRIPFNDFVMFYRRSNMDGPRVLVPIVLFVCATLAFKMLLEAVIRLRMMQRDRSETSLLALLDADRFQRRMGALRSGIALVALACGAGLIEAFGWRDVTPGAVAAVVLPLGLGELIFFFLNQREHAKAS